MFETIDRRNFLRLSGLFGAGALAFGRMPAFAATAHSNNVIGEISSLALVDDTLHLAASARNVAPALRESLAFGINVFEPLPGNAAFFGRHMPAEADDIIRMARAARQGWSNRSDDDRYELSLALGTGWLVQRAGDEIIGPSTGGTEASIYQDAAILRARSATHSGGASPAELESLFNETVPRSLIRFHTLVPDYDDGDGWVVRLQEWRREHASKMQQLATAYDDTSSESYRRLVSEPNFYDPDDEIILLADRARRGELPEEFELSMASSDDNESLYGRALAEGIGRLSALNQYMMGSLDAAALENRLAQA